MNVLADSRLRWVHAATLSGQKDRLPRRMCWHNVAPLTRIAPGVPTAAPMH